MKAWLRKWWVLLALSAGLLLLLLAWLPKSSSPRFTPRTSPPYHVGKPLPPGRVQPQLLVHFDFIVFLAPDGSLWAWGGATVGNCYSILGSVTVPTTPQQIGKNTDWRRVATTGHGLLGVKADGSLWAVGLNQHATLQAPSHGPYHAPFRIGTDSDWATVAADEGHVLALKRDGSLWSWGNNHSGQVGSGIAGSVVSTVTRIGADNNWTTIACGRNNSFALKADSTLWGWGGDPAGNSSFATIPVQFDAATNWSHIAAGSFHATALRADGTLWVLGTLDHKAIFTSFTQLGTDTDWAEIVCGRGHTFARKRDGSWWAFGQTSTGAFLGGGVVDSFPVPMRLPIPLEASALASGRTVVTLAPDGRIWTWGQQPGAPAKLAALDRWDELVNRVNKAWSTLRGHILLDLDEHPCDLTPHLAWELTPSIKAALGTNALGAAKPAP